MGSVTRSFHKQLLILGLGGALVASVVILGSWMRSPGVPLEGAHLPPALLEKKNVSLFKPDPLKLQDVFTGTEQTYFSPNSPNPTLTLVHYWATWCAPCEKELPEFLAFSARVPQITFVVISVDDELRPVKQFVQKHLKNPMGTHVQFLYDPSGESAARWGSLKLPETYVLSPQGVVFDKFEGPQAWLDPRTLTYLEQLRSAFPGH